MVDISKDYLYIDNLVTGVYTPVGGVAYSLSYIKVYPAVDTITGGKSKVGLPTVATKFGVWEDELPFVPRENDNLVVGGESYRILSFVRESLVSRWVLTAMIDAGERLQ